METAIKEKKKLMDTAIQEKEKLMKDNTKQRELLAENQAFKARLEQQLRCNRDHAELDRQRVLHQAENAK